MKNKEFLKLLKRNRSNSNYGFTLTELLVGLIMGTIVIGGLGFGLVNLLRNTQTQTAFSEARNNSSRALDFISDEVKRAVAIENTAVNANGFNSANRTVVFALDIPEIAGNFDEDGDGNLLGVDNNATNTERIVYFLQNVDDMPAGTPWQGPMVLHRWGPALDANGDYSDNNGNAWQAEALIDGIDDTVLTANACNTNAITAANPTAGGQVPSPAVQQTGFYVCIQDDDQDGTFGEPEDTDNIGISAELFLTSGVDIGRTNNDTYTANTQVVARARVAPANNSNNFVSYTMSYRTLGAVYNCNPGDGSTWSMRTDFGNDPSNVDNTLSWVHQEDRQPQPITINTANDLAINTTPVQPLNATINPLTGVVDCLSKGDETATVNTANEPISSFSDGTFPNGHTIPFTMKFVDSNNASTANNWHTFNGDPKTGTRDEPDVKGDGTVLMLKQGSVISASLTGYDFDRDGNENQDSLGKFLESQEYADKVGDDYVINSKLRKDERIMAVEVGQTDSTHPGWDIQDSVIILSSDVFAEKYN